VSSSGSAASGTFGLKSLPARSGAISIVQTEPVENSLSSGCFESAIGSFQFF
jgi:hypothetical protein